MSGPLAERHQLTEQEIEAGKRRGNVICADDYDLASAENGAVVFFSVTGSQYAFRNS